MVTFEDGQLKIALGEANFDNYQSRSEAITQVASLLQSEGNISLESDQALSIIGSVVSADSDGDGSGDLTLTGNSIAVLEATETFASESEHTQGSGKVSVVIQHQAIELAKAARDLLAAEEQVKDAKRDYESFQDALGQSQARLAELQAAYDNQTPGVAYQDLLDLRELVADMEDDELWYQAGIAAAVVNMTSKTTLLVQQTGAASQSTVAYGFNAGVQLDAEVSATNTESASTQSLASQLSGANINLNAATQGGNITVRGSDLIASDTLSLTADSINIEASRDTQSQRTDSETGTPTVAATIFGASSGATVNASYNRDYSRDKAITYTNSQLAADTIVINSTGDTAITGGNVDAAETLKVTVGGDLTVESRQNRSSGNSGGFGLSGGFSLGQSEGGQADSLDNVAADPASALHNPGNLDTVSGVNGGANVSQGRYNSTETVVSSLTSGGTADISVGGNTHISGAIIATVDAAGNDLGNLNLVTETLTYNDLKDSATSSNTSAGVSLNLGFSDAAADGSQGSTDENGDAVKVNTSQYNYSNSQSDESSTVMATLGLGDIQVGDADNASGEADGNSSSDDNSETKDTADALAGLNRDTRDMTLELYEVEQSQDVAMTLDHQLLDSDSLGKLKKELADLPSNLVGYYTDLPAQLLEAYQVAHTEASALVDKVVDLLGTPEAQLPALTPAVSLDAANSALSEQLLAQGYKMMADSADVLYLVDAEGSAYAVVSTEQLQELLAANVALDGKFHALAESVAAAELRQQEMIVELKKRLIEGLIAAYKQSQEGGSETGGTDFDLANLNATEQRALLTNGALKDSMVKFAEDSALVSASLIVGPGMATSTLIDVLAGEEIAELEDTAINIAAERLDVDPESIRTVVFAVGLASDAKGAIKDGVQFVGKKLDNGAGPEDIPNGNTQVNVGARAGAADNEFGTVPTQQLADFKTFGIDANPKNIPEGRALIQEYKNAGLSSAQAERYAKGLIESGSTLPVKKTITEPLYKVVSTGGKHPDVTPYWFTKTELDNLKADPVNALNKLGIPLQSHGVKFDVFEIKPKGNATVFESTVAPTQQGTFRQSGGATQTLVPNRSQFADAVKKDTINLDAKGR